VNWHAKHKRLYAPKEHVYVYLSVLGGMVQKRYVAKQGSGAGRVRACNVTYAQSGVKICAILTGAIF